MSDSDLIREALDEALSYWEQILDDATACRKGKEALAALARVEANMAAMREALGWYARGDPDDQDTWEGPHLAREALAAVSDGETGT